MGTCRDFALMLCALLRELDAATLVLGDRLAAGPLARSARDAVQRPLWLPVPE